MVSSKAMLSAVGLLALIASSHAAPAVNDQGALAPHHDKRSTFSGLGSILFSSFRADDTRGLADTSMTSHLFTHDFSHYTEKDGKSPKAAGAHPYNDRFSQRKYAGNVGFDATMINPSTMPANPNDNPRGFVGSEPTARDQLFEPQSASDDQSRLTRRVLFDGIGTPLFSGYRAKDTKGPHSTYMSTSLLSQDFHNEVAKGNPDHHPYYHPRVYRRQIKASYNPLFTKMRLKVPGAGKNGGTREIEFVGSPLYGNFRQHFYRRGPAPHFEHAAESTESHDEARSALARRSFSGLHTPILSLLEAKDQASYGRGHDDARTYLISTPLFTHMRHEQGHGKNRVSVRLMMTPLYNNAKMKKGGERWTDITDKLEFDTYSPATPARPDNLQVDNSEFHGVGAVRDE
ncbi:hypothetical protein H4R34_000496 [Dimargaris verticillata]|uniref:Uncharacterized protein n=1 Tax=Dimargaris verticillata TaxID=2761393 RepID=A0A9W8B700_9FUNG|nr:hypothetical protein H4R34_000496 [Dimargaris verticillata]